MEIIETRRQCWAIAEENIFYSIIIIFRGGGGGGGIGEFSVVFMKFLLQKLFCVKKSMNRILDQRKLGSVLLLKITTNVFK